MWTAAKLVESTTAQQVYVCSLKGTFRLASSVNKKDTEHPLFSEGKINNELDHVFVITYPGTERIAIKDMNRQVATVVDSWFNNTVCSLSDYMKDRHPYHGYAYASDKKLKLLTKNIEIKESYTATGIPFTVDTEEVLGYLREQREAINTLSDEGIVDENNLQKYEFTVEGQVQDKRSLANLEYLLLEANKVGRVVEEVVDFGEPVFVNLLQSKNPEVLSILYTALDANQEADCFEFFCNMLRQAPIRVIERFHANAPNPGLVSAFFERAFQPATNAAFDQLATVILKKSQQKVALLQAFSEEQFKHVLLGDLKQFSALVKIGEGIKDKLIECLQSLEAENWEGFYAPYSTKQINTLLNGLSKLDAEAALLALAHVPTNKLTLAKLEQLLLFTEPVEQVATFEPDVFKKLLKSTNGKALTALYAILAQEEISSETLFKTLLDKSDKNSIEQFHEYAPAALVTEFFEYIAPTYEEAKLGVFLDKVLKNSKHQATLLQALPPPLFKGYLFGKIARFAKLLSIENLKKEFIACLNEQVVDSDWEELYSSASKKQINGLLINLTRLNKEIGELAASKVPEAKR